MSLESIRNTSSPPRVMTGKPEDGDAAPNLDAERQLAAKACGGDRAAFGTLYERYIDRIYRYVYFKVGNRAQAEDLTSQTFLKDLCLGYPQSGFSRAHSDLADTHPPLSCH